MESYELESTIDTLVLEATKDSQIPIAKTKQLGHSEDAKCIIIGKEIELMSNIK